MEKILLTGGTGFVGASLARLLLAEGFAVRCLVRPKANRKNLDGLPVEIAVGTLTDAASLAAAVAGCKGLFHAAADYRLWVPDKDAMFRANVQGTRTLMQVALSADVRRIVYTSSVATLGLTDDATPATEETPSTYADMIGPYKQSKFLAEQAVMEMVREHHLPAVIVNPSTPIGPRDIKPTPTGQIVVESLKGKMPAYIDTGLNIVHVDDVAAGHLLAYEKGKIGERYILGGDNMDLGRLLRLIASIGGSRPPFCRLPRLALMPLAFAVETASRFTGKNPFITVDGLRMAAHKMYFSSAKAMRELGYSPRRAETAIKDAIEWFQANGYC